MLSFTNFLSKRTTVRFLVTNETVLAKSDKFQNATYISNFIKNCHTKDPSISL